MAINKSWANPANLPAPTQANFPCLFHSFTAADIAANGLSIADPVGGVIITANGGFVKSGTGFYVAASTDTSQTGAWATIGSKAVLMLLTGTTPAFSWGDASGGIAPYIQGNVGAAQTVTKDAADYATFTAIAGTIVSSAVKVDIPNGACKTFGLVSGATSVTSNAATVTGAITGPWSAPSSLISPDNIFPVAAAHALTSVYVLLFNTAPADAEVEGIVGWMAANPFNLPPSLLGRS